MDIAKVKATEEDEIRQITFEFHTFTALGKSQVKQFLFAKYKGQFMQSKKIQKTVSRVEENVNNTETTYVLNYLQATIRQAL